MYKYACAALLIVTCGLGVARAQQSAGYTITPLDRGRPLGGNLRINNNSEVAGASDWDGDLRPFLYTGGTFVDLPNDFRPDDLNDNGQIIGHRSFYYTPLILDGGRLTVLGASFSMMLSAINNSGQVAGYHIPPCCNNLNQAFVYADGVISDLEVIPHMDGMQAYDISNQGHVVGFYTTNSKVYQRAHAFLYKDGEYFDFLVLGSYHRAWGVNDSGHVVGDYESPQGWSHAFLYVPGELALRDLGTLPGGIYSLAFKINNSGQVVGTANIAGGDWHAFLYEGGEMRDLNDLLPPASGWVLTSAVDINDRGEIVGRGTKDGREIGFILGPAKDSQAPTKGARPTRGGAPHWRKG